MPSSKSSLSEEQIFADIMEMISSSNKKSKNTKNVKNSKSKKNMKGGFAPFGDSDVDMSSDLASINQQMKNSPNQPGREMGIDVDSQGVQTDMGNNGEALFSMGDNSDPMKGGKPAKKRVKKPLKKGAKKPVKKAAVKKVVKKVVKKTVAKKPVKKAAKKPVKKVAKKSKTAKK